MKISKKIVFSSAVLLPLILSVLSASYWGWKEGKNRYVFPLAMLVCIVLCIFAMIGWYNEFCKQHAIDAALAKRSISSHKLYAELASGGGLLIFVLTSYMWGVDTDLRNTIARSSHLTQAIVALGGIFSSSGSYCRAMDPENELDLCRIFNTNVVEIRGALNKGGEEKSIKQNIENINSVLNRYQTKHPEMRSQVEEAHAHLSDVDVFDPSMRDKIMFGQMLGLVVVFFSVIRKIAIALFDASKSRVPLTIFKKDSLFFNGTYSPSERAPLKKLAYRKCKWRRRSNKKSPR